MLAIRPAEINDLASIRKIAFDTWPSAYGEILSAEQLDYMLNKFYSLPSLQHQLGVLKHHFIIAQEDDVPVGFAAFSPHEDNPSVFHLNKIYVAPHQQGKNIGKQLLDQVINTIKNASATSLQLNVNRFNKALHFYEKQGFSVIHEEDIDIGEGYYMNDYVLELNW